MKKIKITLLSILALLGLSSCVSNYEGTNTTTPSISLTTQPTKEPTTVPTKKPTTAPTVAPTSAPTTAPTVAPTTQPTVVSTTQPTTAPVVHKAGYEYLASKSESIQSNFDAAGYVENKLPDFSVYENTSSYVQVFTPEELLDALVKAKYEYTNLWVFDARNDEEKALVERLTYLEDLRSNGIISPEEETERKSIEAQLKTLGTPGHVEQELIKEGTVHVIEIMNDLNLGFYTLDQVKVNTNGVYDSVIDDFSAKQSSIIPKLAMSQRFTNNGVSQIKIENTSNLLIYSKNASKLLNCGIKLTSDNNIIVRNIEFDDIWQWEDSALAAPGVIIGDYDAFGWAFFKISNCGYVWIDHCTFGKSYDGQIDYSHPTYAINKSVCFRAPYGADGNNGLHISNCYFKAGDASKDGELYKTMKKIEIDYQLGNDNYLYYKQLRNLGATFEQILNGVAAPQKKGFLLGDSGDQLEYNQEINVSFANNVFKNIEDRLPKIRGGNAYLYNNIIDNYEYISYRTELIKAGVKGISGINGSYKCAIVSQGVVCGLDGSVYAENTMYRGVESLLKNNDKANSSTGAVGEFVNGGYKFSNVLYQYTSDSEAYIGSTTDENHLFNNYNSTPTTLSTDYFKWHTEDNIKPFDTILYSLDELENILYNELPVGANKELADMYLYTRLSDYLK